MSAIARAHTALACTVRGCAEPLKVDANRLVCAHGHAFDLARTGYANLLQPQDRKSVDAGDSRDAVAARRRLADAGVGAPLRDAIAASQKESQNRLQLFRSNVSSSVNRLPQLIHRATRFGHQVLSLRKFHPGVIAIL